LSEAIDLTQSIVSYAANDVFHGPNPDFADLRSLGSDLLQLSKLTIEPFEEGSFVIPARLEAEGIPGSKSVVTTQSVAERFVEMMSAFAQEKNASLVSIGAIQAIESLDRVLHREANAIEFESFGTSGAAFSRVTVDPDYIGRVRTLRTSRQPTLNVLDVIEGTITSLDIRENKLQLSMSTQTRRVTGTFSSLYLPSLLEALGRRVRLSGYVTRKGRTCISVNVTSATQISED